MIEVRGALWESSMVPSCVRWRAFSVLRTNVMFLLQVPYIQYLTTHFSEGALENTKWNDVLVSIVSNIVFGWTMIY